MKILFMCVANSARSQIAEGLARILFPDAEIHSAGSHPGTLNPHAVSTMKEIGIDISQQYSKSFADLPSQFIRDLNFLITLCAEEVCPIILTKARKLHWPLPDPASKDPISDDQALTNFRTAREAIRVKLENFKQDLSS